MGVSDVDAIQLIVSAAAGYQCVVITDAEIAAGNHGDGVRVGIPGGDTLHQGVAGVADVH